MIGFSKKPKLTTIDLSVLKPEQIVYFCSTKHIDQKRAELANLVWDEQLANALEERTKYYFIVTTDLEYDVVSGVLLEPLLKKWNQVQEPLNAKGKKSMMHFINGLNE